MMENGIKGSYGSFDYFISSCTNLCGDDNLDKGCKKKEEVS
jgi:hypothetical protein